MTFRLATLRVLFYFKRNEALKYNSFIDNNNHRKCSKCFPPA
jgi:hypothetical protein